MSAETRYARWEPDGRWVCECGAKSCGADFPGPTSCCFALRPAVRPATPDAEGPITREELEGAVNGMYESMGVTRRGLEGLREYAERNRDMQAELARLRASDAVLRAASERVVANARHAAWCEGRNDAGCSCGLHALRAALSSSGASPTDTNPTASSDPNPEGNRRE